jgi:hypothetical protein
MRKYSTGLSSKALASIVAAVVITAGVFAIAIYLPGTGPNNPTLTSLGAKTASFLNSMRDNVEFYFFANSTFVNDELTSYYAQSHPDAYVDGVRMNRTATGGSIDVLFSPWTADIVGSGQVSTTEWNGLSGQIIDDGIGKMDAPVTPPNGTFPMNWPLAFYFTVFFDDNTCFFAGFSDVDGFLYVQNGTWTGEVGAFGWPMVSGWEEGYWLVEGGHLAAGMTALYTAVTTRVSYPE